MKVRRFVLKGAGSSTMAARNDGNPEIFACESHNFFASIGPQTQLDSR